MPYLPLPFLSYSFLATPNAPGTWTSTWSHCHYLRAACLIQQRNGGSGRSRSITKHGARRRSKALSKLGGSCTKDFGRALSSTCIERLAGYSSLDKGPRKEAVSFFKASALRYEHAEILHRGKKSLHSIISASLPCSVLSTSDQHYTFLPYIRDPSLRSNTLDSMLPGQERQWRKHFATYSLARQRADEQKFTELTRNFSPATTETLEEARCDIHTNPNGNHWWRLQISIEAWRALVQYGWFVVSQEYSEVQQTLSALTITHSAIGEPYQAKLPMETRRLKHEFWLSAATEQGLQEEVRVLCGLVKKLRFHERVAQGKLQMAQNRLARVGRAQNTGAMGGVDGEGSAGKKRDAGDMDFGGEDVEGEPMSTDPMEDSRTDSPWQSINKRRPAEE